MVEQPFIAVDLDEIDDVLGGHVIDPAAAVARIDEGVQPDLGKCARLAAGKAATCLRAFIESSLLFFSPNRKRYFLRS